MKISVAKYFPNTTNKWFWLGFAFIVKFVFFLYFLHQQDKSLFNFTTEVLGHTTGDTWSYLDPVNNFLHHGEYSPDHRMPGYGVIYWLLRLFFNQLVASNLLIFLQLLLATVSVYCLALTAFYIFKSEKYFFATFFIYLFSSYPSYFDGLLITESFAISSLILNIYFLVKHHQSRNHYWLLVSGLFLCWCIFLRPVFISLLFFQLLYLLFFLSKEKIFGLRKIILSALLFMLPFIGAESMWVARNYTHNKKGVFLTQSINYPWAKKDLVAIRNFISSWGGNIYYEPGAEIFWFKYHQKLFNMSDENIKKIKFPEYIYTSKFNYDSLVEIRKLVKQSHDTTLTLNQQNLCQTTIIEKFNTYTQSVKDEKPVVFYLYAPLKILGRFVFQSGSHFLFLKPFNELSICEKGIKLFYSLLYWIIIILGSAGCIAITITHFRKFDIMFIIALIPLYFIFIHSVFFRFPEERYIIPAYPFLTLMAINVFSFLNTNGHRLFRCIATRQGDR